MERHPRFHNALCTSERSRFVLDWSAIMHFHGMKETVKEGAQRTAYSTTHRREAPHYPVQRSTAHAAQHTTAQHSTARRSIAVSPLARGSKCAFVELRQAELRHRIAQRCGAAPETSGMHWRKHLAWRGIACRRMVRHDPAHHRSNT